MAEKNFIGLETHVELKTLSKMFCGCSAEYFGQKPNTHCCPICLGLPGTLPSANKKAIDWCIKIALALNCRISLLSKFDRKNYYYPDLAKGYQISQYDQPIGLEGFLKINDKTIRIRRVHMEEDTAKLIHDKNGFSLIDFNRCGIPLVEIVTEPDFEDSKQVKSYLQTLQQIVRFLDVSNADMEKGQMRLEPNISISLSGDKLPNYKVEVKNINSFRFVEKAIEYELKRQKEILQEKKVPVQETRGWDEKRQKTVSQRIKEEANDYRYFPEPDIPPLYFTKEEIEHLKKDMAELPEAKINRFIKQYNLSFYQAKILVRNKTVADYFQEAVKVSAELKNEELTKEIANWIINKKVDLDKILPSALIRLIISSGQKTHVDKNKLIEIIEKVILDNPKAVSDYKTGKTNSIMFLIGQIMQKLTFKTDVSIIKTELETKLKT